MYVIKSTSVFSWEEQEREGRRRREETHLTLTERERVDKRGWVTHWWLPGEREMGGAGQQGDRHTDTTNSSGTARKTLPLS